MFAPAREPLKVVVPAPLRRRRSLSAPLTLTPLRLSGAEQPSPLRSSSRSSSRSSLQEEISCLSPLRSPLPCLLTSTVDRSQCSTPASMQPSRSFLSSPSKMLSAPAGGICATPSRAVNWPFLDEPGPIWQEPDTATAAPPELPELPSRCWIAPPRSNLSDAVAEQQAEQQAPDARSDARSVPPLRPDSAWRNVTLAQLVASKRSVEASVAAGRQASFRRRKASLQAAEAQRSACAAADSVQDCVALMLEDFRLINHQV